ncbi:hypothetical protein ACEPAH_3858 [Sanghuangporus vaninii]
MITLSPEIIEGLVRRFLLSQNGASSPLPASSDPSFDPAIVIAPSEISNASDSLGEQPDVLEVVSAMRNEIVYLNERLTSSDADDEGDGRIRRNSSRRRGCLLGGTLKHLSEEEQMVRKEITRRVRPVMTALTNSGEDPQHIEDDDTIPENEKGFVPDYDRPPKFNANEELISRTVELVCRHYDQDPQTSRFASDGVEFTKKDCYQFATTAFENKKRAYQIQKNAERKKKADRAKRNNRRHGRRRQTKDHRQKYATKYKEKYGVELPDETFQSDFMIDLISELDSSDIATSDSTDSADDADSDVDARTTRKLAERTRRVKAARETRFSLLAAQASLTQKERRQKIKLWEERKLQCRSKRLNRIYKRLDRLADDEREGDSKDLRRWARRVSIGNTSPRIPKVKKRVWPFMIDKAWLADDPDLKKARWTKLQRSDPDGLVLGIDSDVGYESSDYS